MDIALPRRGGVRRVPCHSVIPRCLHRGGADGACAVGFAWEKLLGGVTTERVGFWPDLTRFLDGDRNQRARW
eukprot:2191089-Heterocapsa_arctica.AAC.1